MSRIIRCIAQRYSIVLQAAIKAQSSNRRLMVLLKHAELHFLFCPSADCAMLFVAGNQSKRRLAEAQYYTDNCDYEEAKEEDLHRAPP
jgi:hypothetical protein